MEEKRYQILDIKKNISELKEEYSDAKRAEIAWISSVAMGALILGVDIAANAVVFDMIKDNPIAVSLMPIYATLGLAGAEAFSIKRFIQSVKEARSVKKELNNQTNEFENSFEELGVKSL